MINKFALLLIAAVPLAFAAPAKAQVSVGVGGGDVGVRVGVGPDRGYHRGWRHRDRFASDCRVIKTRTVTPRGRVIIETRRVCD